MFTPEGRAVVQRQPNNPGGRLVKRTLVAVALAAVAALIGVSPNPVPAATARVTKVLVVIEENHSLSQMQSQMPYAYSLAKRYGYAGNYTAITHPSLPNYLAIAGGSTFGVTDDNYP